MTHFADQIGLQPYPTSAVIGDKAFAAETLDTAFDARIALVECCCARSTSAD